MDRDLWELKVGAEISAMYHDWRRSTVASRIRFAKTVTFVGAAITLITSMWEPPHMHAVLAICAIAIAIVNLWELAARWDDLALQHTELYRRFSDLLSRVAGEIDPTSEMLHKWASEAALIRKDEPPTMWAVYAMCWNQIMQRHYGKDAQKHSRDVRFFYYVLQNLLQFRPADFPLESEKAVAT